MVILLLLGSGCGRRSRPRLPDPDPPPVSHLLEGLASWYGRDFHGKPTASGEIFDMYKFTAAHQTLPFGTVVRVQNLLSSRTVVVRINDRGPFRSDRIIDLSYAAAVRLDMIRDGVIPVRITLLN
ncbi:MAG: septal ring lytic transglycosylase RlpA family protein [Acidobacteria bacterium]|nr:septal ring lytic transglycosylase RlpA family protein [Acidobacteriota bacterium]